jgi:hypothetical protein
MATKVRLMKLLQEVRGMAEITNRRFVPKPPMLYLMELRARSVAAAASTSRRLVIRVDARDIAEIPDPVKITFACQDGSDSVHSPS